MPSAAFQYFFLSSYASASRLSSLPYLRVCFVYISSLPSPDFLALLPHASEQMISSIYSKSFEAWDMRVPPNIVKRRPSAPVRTR